MKAYYGQNLNVKEDLFDKVLNEYLGEIAEIKDIPEEKCYELTFKGETFKTLGEEFKNPVRALLAIRVKAEQLKFEDVSEFLETEDFVTSFFKTNFVKVIKSKKDLNRYRNKVLASANLETEKDLLDEKSNLAIFERIDSEGYEVFDVLSMNLDPETHKMIDKLSLGFNAGKCVEGLRTNFFKPANAVISQFGEEVARTGAQCVAELAGNVLATGANAVSEAGVTFFHTLASDGRVAEIATDGRLADGCNKFVGGCKKIGTSFFKRKSNGGGMR